MVVVMLRRILTISIVAILILCDFVIAQVIGDSAPQIRAVKTDSPPIIDGCIDDKCWNESPVITDFISHKTQQVASDQTIVKILYSDTHIYLSAECFESDIEELIATERKYDRKLWAEDNFEVQFDTLNDSRSRYVFVVNPIGTRFDARVSVFGWNSSWDCDWDVVCVETQESWIVEMAIPLDELLLVTGDDITWGINFHRSDKSSQEDSTWSYNPDDTFASRWFGKFTNHDLSDVEVDCNPSYEYYISSTVSRKGGGDEMSTGLDVSKRMSSQIMGAFTLNPDFGQIEADTDTIELRDTERFLPERRTFFKEGAELFHTPLKAYYSRRFTDINAGMKFTGVGKDWNFGVIDIEGEVTNGGVTRKGNYLVGRLMRNVGDNSHVGMIFTNSQREVGYNRVAGVDWRTYLNDNTKWTSQVLGMLDESLDENGLLEKTSGYAIDSTIKMDQRPLHIGFTYSDITKDFQPDLGYIPRKDIRGCRGWMNIKDNVDDDLLEWCGVGSSFTYYESHDKDVALRDNNSWGSLKFTNDVDVRVWRNVNYHAPYSNVATGLRVSYNMDDYWKSVEGDYSWGEFNEVPYDQLSLSKPMIFGERLTTKLTGNYRMEQAEPEKNSVWLWRVVSEYTFLWDGRVKFTFEETSQESHNMTLLFSWYPKGSIDVYFLVTDFEGDGEQDQSLFTKVVCRF